MKAATLLLLAGCLPPGRYTLRALPAPASGQLTVQATGHLDYRPVNGFDLYAEVVLTHDGQSNPRFNLARAQVRADDLEWEPCRFPADFDTDALIFVMKPGEQRKVAIQCLNIPRPHERLELRVFASGTGGSGPIDVPFTGVAAGAQPE